MPQAVPSCARPLQRTKTNKEQLCGEKQVCDPTTRDRSDLRGPRVQCVLVERELWHLDAADAAAPALGWRSSQNALMPACLASVWALGSLLGARLRGHARLWGSAFLACALLWLVSPVLVSWRIPYILMPPGSPGSLALALLAVLLGASSAAWLAQQGAWPQAGERTALVRGLVGLTVGLLVAWMLPASGGLLALACCLPLLALDAFLSGRAPLPTPGGVAARWMHRYWSTEGWPVQVERRGLLQSWRGFCQSRSLEPAHGTFPLGLLASAVAVVLGSIWGAIPTPSTYSTGCSEARSSLWLLEPAVCWRHGMWSVSPVASSRSPGRRGCGYWHCSCRWGWR